MCVFLLSSLKNEGLYDKTQTMNILWSCTRYVVFLIQISVRTGQDLRRWYVINPHLTGFIQAHPDTFSRSMRRGRWQEADVSLHSSGSCVQDVGCQEETAGSSARSPSTLTGPAVSSISVSAYLLCSKNSGSHRPWPRAPSSPGGWWVVARHPAWQCVTGFSRRESVSVWARVRSAWLIEELGDIQERTRREFSWLL